MRRINPKPVHMDKKPIALFACSLVLATGLFLLQGCKPEDKPDPTGEAPEITSVSPLQGMPGATVTIKGKNFKDGTGGVVVNFKAYPATVTSSTVTTIVCTVPEMPAGDAAIVVSIDGTSSGAYTGFKVVEATDPATVTGFGPDNGSVGDEVVITGTNFGDDQSIVKVIINDMPQEIQAMTDSTIAIKLVPKIFSGEVVVTKSGVKYTAPNGYNYVETYAVKDFGSFDVESMAVDKDGNIYMTFGNIYKVDTNGNVVKTIMDKKSKVDPSGLFYADNDTLYIADNWGRILYLVPGEDVVDTLVHRFEDVNIKVNYLQYITGDNQGNLYFSSGAAGHSVTKYNLSQKKSEVIFTEPNNETVGTLAYHDGRIYCTTDYGVSSVTTDGKGYTRLVDQFNTFLDMAGIVYYEPLDIFYLGGEENKNLYKMGYDGSLTEVLKITQSVAFITLDNNGNLLFLDSNIKKIVIQ
jgi:sugar lactone lactonase YvrE